MNYAFLSEVVVHGRENAGLGVFDELLERAESFKNGETPVETPTRTANQQELFSLDHLSDLCIETNNCCMKYHSSVGDERLVLS